MSPIVQLYWIRVALGLVAGLVSAIVAFYLGPGGGLNILVDTITIALIVYLASYYPLRAVYKTKVEKPSKILSTGIFMYFMIWLPFMVLFYTIAMVYF